MIKHLMMLSTGNHEKIGDHYEKQMKAKTGFAVIMILFTAVLSSRKDKLRERYGIEGTVLRDGAEEEFIVNDRREWIGFLKEKCGM